MISERILSFRRRCWMASFMVKQYFPGIRHYCTGMRPFLIFIVGAALLAQTPQQKQQQKKAEPEEMPTIKVDVDIVSILASVRDKKGTLIPNLEQKDFTVL